MSLLDLIGKQIESIDMDDYFTATYCCHVDSDDYRRGITKYENEIPSSITIKFTDGSQMNISAETLGEAYREEGASYLSIGASIKA